MGGLACKSLAQVSIISGHSFQIRVATTAAKVFTPPGSEQKESLYTRNNVIITLKCKWWIVLTVTRGTAIYTQNSLAITIAILGLSDSGIFSIHDSLGYTTHDYEYYHDTSREV